MTGPSLRYPGAKWGSQGSMARWIESYFPAHAIYAEPFFGSGGVFFNKRPSQAEYINDLDGEIVNLFRVMRDDWEALVRVVEATPYALDEYQLSCTPADNPLEQARRTLVKHWMSVGADGNARGYVNGWRHLGKQAGRAISPPDEWGRVPERIMVHAKRIKHAHIDNLPAIESLSRVNGQKALAYVDPPYLKEVRAGRMYRVEMLETDKHIELLRFLRDDWRGMAVLSGYVHEIYDEFLTGWQRVTRNVSAGMGQSRVEALWINPAAQQGRLL